GWGCKVMKAPDLPAAVALTQSANVFPHGLLVDYHLGHGTGIEAITALRQLCNRDLPAILITAGPSTSFGGESLGHNIRGLYNPVKPAALRALLAQWRFHRVAAE